MEKVNRNRILSIKLFSAIFLLFSFTVSKAQNLPLVKVDQTVVDAKNGGSEEDAFTEGDWMNLMNSSNSPDASTGAVTNFSVKKRVKKTADKVETDVAIINITDKIQAGIRMISTRNGDVFTDQVGGFVRGYGAEANVYLDENGNIQTQFQFNNHNSITANGRLTLNARGNITSEISNIEYKYANGPTTVRLIGDPTGKISGSVNYTDRFSNNKTWSGTLGMTGNTNTGSVAVTGSTNASYSPTTWGGYSMKLGIEGNFVIGEDGGDTVWITIGWSW